MRVRLLRSVVYRNREHPIGALLDVSDGLARSLIDGGAAEQLKALSSPPNNKARLSAPLNK